MLLALKENEMKNWKKEEKHENKMNSNTAAATSVDKIKNLTLFELKQLNEYCVYFWIRKEIEILIAVKTK